MWQSCGSIGQTSGKITVLLSANILKNAMGVGIPGTGMIGLPIAVALGALIGKSEYQLEVLKDCNPDAVEEGRRFIDEKRIHIALKDGIKEKLYVEVCCEVGDEKSTAIIAGGHTSFVYMACNGEVLLNKQAVASTEKEEGALDLSLRKVYDFALTAPLDEIRFILETARLNKAAAESSFEGDYGHGLGKSFVVLTSIRLWGTVFFPYSFLYFRCLRCPYGRSHDSGHE